MAMNVDSRITSGRFTCTVGAFLVATVVHRGGAQRVLTGTVTDSAGRAVQNAFVIVNGLESARSDSAGRYVISGLTVGPVRVRTSALGYERFDTTLVRTRRDTTSLLIRLKAALPLDGVPDVWLGCAASNRKCADGRRITNELRGFAQSPSAWYFGDSTAFATFWAQHDLVDRPASAVPPIDWRREAIVAVSYGSYAGCAPERYVNRIEWNRDTAIVVVGPDTVKRRGRFTCQVMLDIPDVVAIPRPSGPVRWRAANRQWPVPLVDGNRAPK